MMKNFITLCCFTLCMINAQAQYSAEALPVRNVKLVSIFDRVKDSIKKQFEAKGLSWPAKYMYIRSFKHEKQLEVWVKHEWSEAFKLFKSYKVCATSGSFGPKRKEGDKQIPEGFYYINEFRPNSTYHLALGLNYPNLSDEILSDSKKPGGDIYIHGDCVTIGCLPLTDSLIEEVYYLSFLMKERGQDFIPVHVFPMRYDSKKATAQFVQRTKNKPDVQAFSMNLRDAYEYFEDTRQLPVIMVNNQGGYVIATDPAAPRFPRMPIDEEEDKSTDPFDAFQPVTQLDVVPQFEGGNAALQRWLYQLSVKLGETLPEGTSVNMQVEFIVDTEGNTRVPRISKGGSDALNKIVLERFEKELKWKPAMKGGEKVNSILKQNVNITAPEDL